LPFDEAAARQALEKILRDHSLGGVWLIQDGDEAIGYVVLTLGDSLEYHGRDAFVDEIYICESHRGRGIGAQAIKFVEKICRSLDVRALHLEVERAVLFMDVVRPLRFPVSLLNKFIIWLVSLSAYVQDAKKFHEAWEKRFDQVVAHS
jgi:GNAT superfamily N-acetyltransferase